MLLPTFEHITRARAALLRRTVVTSPDPPPTIAREHVRSYRDRCLLPPRLT
jgi:hypothetical protein